MLALLLWLGFLATDPARPVLAFTGAIARFVPDNASHDTVTVTTPAGSHAGYVEHARYRGGAYTVTVPTTSLGRMNRDEWNPPQWWRESLLVPQTGSRRIILRALTDAGVRRHLQSWDAAGMAFTPGLLELPADAAPGREWGSEGQVDTGSARGRFQHRARAVAAAETGCLDVTSTITLTGGEAGRTWSERATWCPDRGPVSASGTDSAGGALATWQVRPDQIGYRPTVEQLADRPPDAAGRATWTQGTVRALDGDETFGYRDLDLLSTSAPAVTQRGNLVLTQVHTDDVQTLLRTRQDSHLQATWIRPGGKILTLTPLGDLFAVTTSERRLVVYDSWGVLLWRATTDDVAVAAPLRIGADRLAVVTLSGRLTVFEAATGRELWTQSLPRGVPGPWAADDRTLLLVDNQHELQALSAADGSSLWSHDLGGQPAQLALQGDRALFLSGGGAVTALDRESGRLAWRRPLGAGGEEFAVSDDAVGARTQEGLEVLDLASGRRRFELPGVAAHTYAAGSWWVLVGGEIRALDASGRVEASYPTERQSYPEFRVGGGRVWLFQRSTETTLHGTWIGPR